MPDGLQLLQDGFKDNSVRGFLIRLLWVLGVSGHIAWACGWLAFIGLQAPWATAAEVAAQKVALTKLEDAANISAALSIAQEIRAQVLIRCRTGDQSINYTIDRLQVDYIRYSPSKVAYPVPPCPVTAP